MHRLTGHQGVIFDTVLLQCNNGNTRIGSVSDDRSVRVWEVREDGSSSKQIAEMYGHTQRIWKLAQVTTATSSAGMLVASVSEDATCKVWSIDE